MENGISIVIESFATNGPGISIERLVSGSVEAAQPAVVKLPVFFLYCGALSSTVLKSVSSVDNNVYKRLNEPCIVPLIINLPLSLSK